MRKYDYYLVDVFTSRQFGGNPLAVLPDAQGLDQHLMQKIANEFNLSETTFVLPAEDTGYDCQVRIFTPAIELPMAGHPTLGTAFVLMNNHLLSPNNENFVVFKEGVGLIKVHFDPGNDSRFTMEQPLPEFRAIYENKADFEELLSLDGGSVDKNLPIQIVSCGVPFWFVPIIDLENIKKAKVRLDLLDKYLSNYESQALFLFTLETEEQSSSIHCRLFAPTLGVMEDPATGSAAGPMGSYLVKYGMSKGKGIIGEQGFEMGRPSIINIDIETTAGEISKVKVSGESVSIAQGLIHIDN